MEFNKNNFQAEVEENKDLVLVDFFAPWCGPCKLMLPIVDNLIQEYQGKEIKIGKVNIDENSELAEKYGVMGVPTFIFFKAGKIIDQFSGYRSKEEINELIDKYLAE
jgi:thioredoxin 1